MLFKAMGITDQLVIAAKKQELVREVESTIPEYDALSNTYQVNRDGAVETYAELPDCFPPIVLASSQASDQSVVEKTSPLGNSPSEQPSDAQASEPSETKERHYLTSYI